MDLSEFFLYSFFSTDKIHFRLLYHRQNLYTAMFKSVRYKRSKGLGTHLFVKVPLPETAKGPFRGTRRYGVTTLSWPILLWPFLALPILLLVHFWADLFGTNFTKIICFFCFLFQFFLIYRKKFFCLSFFLFFSFKNSQKIFCLFVIYFFPLYIKKYKFKHTTTVFLFGYSSNR